MSKVIMQQILLPGVRFMIEKMYIDREHDIKSTFNELFQKHIFDCKELWDSKYYTFTNKEKLKWRLHLCKGPSSEDLREIPVEKWLKYEMVTQFDVYELDTMFISKSEMVTFNVWDEDGLLSPAVKSCIRSKLYNLHEILNRHLRLESQKSGS